MPLQTYSLQEAMGSLMRSLRDKVEWGAPSTVPGSLPLRETSATCRHGGASSARRRLQTTVILPPEVRRDHREALEFPMALPETGGPQD